MKLKKFHGDSVKNESTDRVRTDEGVKQTGQERICPPATVEKPLQCYISTLSTFNYFKYQTDLWRQSEGYTITILGSSTPNELSPSSVINVKDCVYIV